MRRIIIAAAATAAFLFSISCYAVTSSNSELITAAAYANDVPQLQELSEQSTGYDRAYALYRLAQLSFAEPDKHLQPQLDQATAILETMTAPEAKVLLAAVHNLSMGLDPRRAPQLASEVAQLLSAAKQDEQSRGRALLVEGINRFFTPPAYGGGVEVARDLLQQAAQHFDSRPDQTGSIRWGEAEVDLWLGQVYAALQQPAQALRHYDRALSADPACLWAQHFKARL